MRKINNDGRELIKHFEGCRLTMYRDGAGFPTIGWGRMNPQLKVGDRITQAQADEMLEQDLIAAESVVMSLVKGALNDNQFAALVSFVYNLGAPRLRGSTLLKLINAGDMGGAADEFLKWNHVAGNVDVGLTRRREAEKELFTKTVT